MRGRSACRGRGIPRQACRRRWNDAARFEVSAKSLRDRGKKSGSSKGRRKPRAKLGGSSGPPEAAIVWAVEAILGSQRMTAMARLRSFRRDLGGRASRPMATYGALSAMTALTSTRDIQLLTTSVRSRGTTPRDNHSTNVRYSHSIAESRRSASGQTATLTVAARGVLYADSRPRLCAVSGHIRAGWQRLSAIMWSA
jgi:hypothetical protein